jgi:hypothetical protein
MMMAKDVGKLIILGPVWGGWGDFIVLPIKRAQSYKSDNYVPYWTLMKFKGVFTLMDLGFSTSPRSVEYKFLI